MTNDKPIFSARLRSKEKLQPTQEQLDDFLKSIPQGGSHEPYGNAFLSYRQLIGDLDAFKQQQADTEQPDLREYMFYKVLGHSEFVNHALLSAVTEYGYHLHALSLLEFKSLTLSINDAERKLNKLNKQDIEDVVRMMRLQEMIGERKKLLAALKERWVEMTAELRAIALYVRENLVRIEKRCEAAIVILSDLNVRQRKGTQLIDDIKKYFKERLKNALHNGQVTKQDLENAKKAIDLLSNEILDNVTWDADAVTRLYEIVRDQARKTAIQIAVLLADIESKKSGSVEEKVTLYSQVGQVLARLVSDHRIVMIASKPVPETPHEEVIKRKRKEVFDFLFEKVLQDRRESVDRRRPGRSDYKGPEKRRNKDRRARKSR
jgi:hypothetical protein